MDTSKLGLIPLSNFGLVLPPNAPVNNIYRSAQPLHKYNYEWLKKYLNITHIFNLRSENDIDSKYAELLDITEHKININDHHEPTVRQAQQFQTDILSINTPILIHCEHGHGRTSTFSVLTKLAYGYTIEEAIKDEEERHLYNFKHLNQLYFLKNFNKQITQN